MFATKSPPDRMLRNAVTISQHPLPGDGFLEVIGATTLREASGHPVDASTAALQPPH